MFTDRKGAEGDGLYREKGVKYFEDRKVGNRSELHFIKHKDTKKLGNVLRSKLLEEILEKQLKVNSKQQFDFELYVVFGTPKFDDGLIDNVFVTEVCNE